MRHTIAMCLGALLLSLNCHAEEFATPKFVLNLPKGWNRGPVTNLGTSVGYEFRSNTSASYVLIVVNSTWASAKATKEEQERHVQSQTADSFPEDPVRPVKLARCKVAGTEGFCADWQRKDFRGESLGWMTDGLVFCGVIAIASADTENVWTDMDRAIRTIVPIRQK